MRRQSDTDRVIAALAARQFGAVARAQLLDIPLNAQSIDRRVQRGRLHLVHRGVYAVGHPVLKAEGRWMAATLATGGALSHLTAAAAWDLRPSASGAIHVTVEGCSRRRTGVRVHRTRALEATVLNGIPITTPVRTIIDLATTMKGRALEQALDRAEQRRLLNFAELHRRPIPPSLRAVLTLYTAGAAPTRSELEERFLRLCDDHRLSRPEVNTRIEEIEVDFAWRGARLIVEVDGYAYHRSPTAFEIDRERDATLTAAGWRVLRFTWAQITRRPGWVARAVSSALSVDPRGTRPSTDRWPGSRT